MSGFRRSGIPLAALVASVAGISAYAAPAPPQNPGPTQVSLSLSGCSTSWAHPHGGLQTFTITNTADVAMEVSLNAVPSQESYVDLDGVGPGVSRTFSVDLNNGDYQFRCMPDESDAIVGAKVTVAGAPAGDKGSPHAKAITFQDLVAPAQKYQAWVQPQLIQLKSEVQLLAERIHAGDDSGAKAQWIKAHELYESLGAAYGAFGDADGAINGTTAGLPAGVKDSGFTGFHALESSLWRSDVALGNSRSKLADQLVGDVSGLSDSFAKARVDPLDIGLRAHEIMENSIQFELSGRTDYGSHSNLLTVSSNLNGTAELIQILTPLLKDRLPDLAGIMADLHSAQALVNQAIKAPASAGDRTGINAAISGLTEKLAQVAAVADIRRTS